MTTTGSEAEPLPRRAGVPVVDGVALRGGTRVRLRPTQRADIVDLTLAGRVAEIDRVEEGADDRIYVVVALVGDPALDLGPMSQLGHRFFFAPEELEPLEANPEGEVPRVLVAGVGDSFHPDGAFASAVVERLRRRRPPNGVHVADFGIRTADLIDALPDYDEAVLISTARRGRPPGTLAVSETASDELGLVRGPGFDRNAQAGERRSRTLVLTCEPSDATTAGAVSEPMLTAVDAAVRLAESVVDSLGTPRNDEDW